MGALTLTLNPQLDLEPLTLQKVISFFRISSFCTTNLSGAEAYAIYGEKVQECLKKVGAEMTFSGVVSRLMLGEVEDLWDSVAIARYPSRKAMLEMIMDPYYQEIEKHRSAGLEGQLNIETKYF